MRGRIFRVLFTSPRTVIVFVPLLESVIDAVVPLPFTCEPLPT